jgi:predicted dehydrogenase
MVDHTFIYSGAVRKIKELITQGEIGDIYYFDSVRVNLGLSTSEERYQALIQYRTGDMYAPKLDQTEPLELVCKHFVECVRTGKTPLTDGEAGLKVVRLLEAAQQSLQSLGGVIKL